MHVFNLNAEQAFDPKKHMERVLGRIREGDVTIACWEPGQTSPYHCHPNATEIYFCFEGGGRMRTPTETIEIGPGSFVVHPRGELHEYANGPQLAADPAPALSSRERGGSVLQPLPEPVRSVDAPLPFPSNRHAHDIIRMSDL